MIDGSEVVLTEGSNSKGCFVSVHLVKGKSYLIFPAGWRGRQWSRVSSFFGKEMADLLPSEEGNHQGTVGNIHEGIASREHSKQIRSFKDVLLGSQGDRVEYRNRLDVCLCALEKAVIELRLHLLPPSGSSDAEAANPNLGMTWNSRQILSNLMDRIDSDKTVSASSGLPGKLTKAGSEFQSSVSDIQPIPEGNCTRYWLKGYVRHYFWIGVRRVRSWLVLCGH